MSDLVRALVFATAHWCGGSIGAAIAIVTLLFRLVMLPLGIRMARRARQQAAILASIKVELEQLHARHAADPAALWRAQREVHRAAGYRPFDPGALVGVLIQWPLMASLHGAVRRGLAARVTFLWIADLARPDRVLVALVTILVATATAALLPREATRNMAVTMMVVSTVGTFAFLWFASSAIALSYGTGSLVSMLQGWLVRRDQRLELAR